MKCEASQGLEVYHYYQPLSLRIVRRNRILEWFVAMVLGSTMASHVPCSTFHGPCSAQMVCGSIKYQVGIEGHVLVYSHARTGAARPKVVSSFEVRAEGFEKDRSMRFRKGQKRGNGDKWGKDWLESGRRCK